MAACVESRAMFTGIPAPAWATRVARPVGDGFRMAEELRGVPRPALQTVFGKVLGRRIWEGTRAKGVTAASCPATQVADAEISVGMVEYVSQRAADTLRGRGRLAKALSLTVTYTDGESRLLQSRLARATNEDDEIAEAAAELLRRLPSHGVQAVDLRVTSVEVAFVRERANGLACSLASASTRA